MIFPPSTAGKSGFGVDYNAPDEETVAKVMKAKWDLGLKGGSVIANPIPKEYELDYDEMEAVINKALKAAQEEGIHGKATTPFLLAHIKEFTDGVSLASNLQLAYHNAKEAAKLLWLTVRCNTFYLHQITESVKAEYRNPIFTLFVFSAVYWLILVIGLLFTYAEVIFFRGFKLI